MNRKTSKNQKKNRRIFQKDIDKVLESKSEHFRKIDQNRIKFYQTGECPLELRQYLSKKYVDSFFDFLIFFY